MTKRSAPIQSEVKATNSREKQDKAKTVARNGLAIGTRRAETLGSGAKPLKRGAEGKPHGSNVHL